MRTLLKRLELDNRQYYSTAIHIVNALLSDKLSHKEIEILSIFMSFTGDLAKNRFSTTGKDIVKNELNMSNQSLWNYLKKFKEKNIIVLKQDPSSNKTIYEINSLLFPTDAKSQKYFIELINNDNKQLV